MDRTIIIWDLITGEKVKVLSGHGKGVNFLALTPDGDLVSADLASGIFLWSFNNWTLDLKLLSDVKQEIKVTVTDDSISVQAEHNILVLCQQLLYYCIGPSQVKITMTNNDLHIEALSQEKYQRITDLFAAINKRIKVNMPINWKPQKPAPQVEGSGLNRSSASGSGRSSFFGEARSSKDKVSLVLPEPAQAQPTTTTTTSAPVRGLQVGSPERKIQIGNLNKPEGSRASSNASPNLKLQPRAIPSSPLTKPVAKEDTAPSAGLGN